MSLLQLLKAAYEWINVWRFEPEKRNLTGIRSTNIGRRYRLRSGLY